MELSKNTSAVYYGTQEVTKVYFGTQLVWEKAEELPKFMTFDYLDSRVNMSNIVYTFTDTTFSKFSQLAKRLTIQEKVFDITRMTRLNDIKYQIYINSSPTDLVTTYSTGPGQVTIYFE